MNNFLKAASFGAAFALGAPFSAAADTITIDKTYTGIFGPDAFYSDVKIGGDAYNNMHVYAGGFHVTTSTSESFVAWCVDLAQYLSLPSTYETSDTPFSTVVTDNLSRLFTGFLAGIDSADEGAAFQVAIWEVISDDTFDLDDGNFQVFSNPGVKSTADSYLTNLGQYDAAYDLSFFLSSTSQDLVTGEPHVPAVPLPASGLFLIAGMAALGYGARKRR